MHKQLLAFDFGGTKLSAATTSAEELASARPNWTSKRRVFSPPGADAAYDLQNMTALGQELLGAQRPSAIGVSFGGPADFSSGRVLRSDHVPGWQNVPLQAALEETFGVPVRIDNDANVGALGEAKLGAGRRTPDLFYITISTGVGGGLILNGRLWRGLHGLAGEIGHVVVDPGGPTCLCGKRGCVERLASGPYMSQDARQELARSPENGRILADLAGGKPITGEIVARAAVAGDEIARKILLRGARALGLGIGNTANLLDIPLFVLGGGVTRAGSLWWDEVRRSARSTALAGIKFEVVPAALADDAPLWGAAFLAQSLL